MTSPIIGREVAAKVNTKDVVTPRRLAEELGVASSTLRGWLRARYPDAPRRGRRWLLDATAVAQMRAHAEGGQRPVPAYEGWFIKEPDPALRVELLIVERRNDMRRPWELTGALAREIGGSARWIAEWVDAHWDEADPQLLWDYLVYKGGGNGITEDVAFVRVRSLRDAARLARHFRAQVLRARCARQAAGERDPS
jgi:hypothetical protein